MTAVDDKELAYRRLDPDTGRYHWAARRNGDGQLVAGECDTDGEAMAEMLLAVAIPAEGLSIAYGWDAEWEKRTRNSP
jgi:hypothetical protein